MRKYPVGPPLRFVSGTPTFLMNLAKREQLYDFENVTIAPTQLDSYNIEYLQLSPLMFQTGYLTIKAIDEDGLFLLSYPNEEVRQSYLVLLSCTDTLNFQAIRHLRAESSANC